jgi:protein O-GlcNAc transferase
MAETMADALHLYVADRIEEAAAICQAIVARDPGCGEAWDRLGRIAERQGHPEQAEACYERAIAALAEPAEVHNNLAVLLQRRGDFERALHHYRRAVALGLRHALLHSNLGCLLRDLGHLQDGVDEFMRALELDASSAHAHSNLGVTLALQAEVDRALPHLRLAVALQPDWDLAHSNLLFCLNYADSVTPAAVAAQHRAYGRRHPEPEGPGPRTEPDPERKLRVAFVSPDLKHHSVAYFLEPLLGAYDRAWFEFYAYSDVTRPDAVSERMQAKVDRWRPIHSLGDADVARLIRADRIDILIDLAGHTARNRMSLFAQPAAPVQMSYLGYPNTTGLETMHWRLTDAWADPPGTTEALHSEELLRLPGGFLCFRPHEAAGAGLAPAAPPARTGGGVTFGSFNLQAKISPTVIDLWGAILEQVPGSRLCLKGPGFADPATRALFERRLGASRLRGQAVELLAHLPEQRDHLAVYGQLDIALDTFPYGGTTTTCEALWMGVPVVTLAGRAHASRVGASLLGRLELTELVARSPAEYVAIAVGLARAPTRLAALRASMRERMIASGLTNAASHARAFEQALRQAWRSWCEKLRAAARPLPAGLALAPLPGNLQVVVADTLEQITPYVLAEQHDWFEDEMAFVRGLLDRGQRAVDVGANHGVYTLTLAREVGSSGRVWAFEPGSAVAERLQHSLAINALPQVTLVEAALSSREGRGRWLGGAQSELNALRAAGDGDGESTGDGQTVALRTLDACAESLGIEDIAYVKIDAEGAEADILEGGRRFFTAESPLVMFEIRHGAAVNLDLVARFAALGYASYRLLPGLGLLAPLAALEPIDPYLLNVFACKPDRARILQEKGLLAPAGAPPAQLEAPPPGAWRAHLHAQLFTAPLWPRWAGWSGGDEAAPLDRAYRLCLDHYAIARRITEPPEARCAHLARALAVASACAREAPAIPILQTLARITWEAGQRAVAVQVLDLLVERCSIADAADAAKAAAEPLDRPFLTVSPRFDDIPPAGASDDGAGDVSTRRWLLAAALEQRERLRAFSSFYTRGDPDTTACLETMATLGYQSREMARRLDLVKRRARPG